MAEAFYNHTYGEKASISAGIVNSEHKYGGSPRPDVIDIMKEIGVSMSGHKIKHLTMSMLDQAEKVIVLCSKEICPQIILERTNVVYINVEDPPDKDKTIGVLRNMRDQINQIVSKL